MSEIEQDGDDGETLPADYQPFWRRLHHLIATDAFLLDGRQLAAVRQGLDMSVADLAFVLGITPQTINRWESGALGIRHPIVLELALERLLQIKQAATAARVPQASTTAATSGEEDSQDECNGTG